jgi:hypothetical protein
VAGLDAPPAAPAAADVHAVAGDVGGLGLGEVFLVLVGHPLVRDVAAAAVWACLGQRHVHLPIDPLGHHPTRAHPVVRPGLATRPFRIGLGAVAGKRRGLTLARPFQLLDPGPQPLVVPPQLLILRMLCPQHRVLAAQLRILRTQSDILAAQPRIRLTQGGVLNLSHGCRPVS